MAKLDGVGLGYSYHLPSGGWLLKIRNVLSQFSDLFSEFDKYIAPAYHHDRCERLVKLVKKRLIKKISDRFTCDYIQCINANLLWYL